MNEGIREKREERREKREKRKEKRIGFVFFENVDCTRFDVIKCTANADAVRHTSFIMTNPSGFAPKLFTFHPSLFTAIIYRV